MESESRDGLGASFDWTDDGPRVGFSETAFMRADPVGFISHTLPKKAKLDALTAVRALRERGYPVAGFEWVDCGDTLGEMQEFLPDNVQPISFHGPIFADPRSVLLHLRDVPTLSYAAEMIAAFLVSGSFAGKLGRSEVGEHIVRLETLASVNSSIRRKTPITVHPHVVKVLGQQGLFPRGTGSVLWSIEPDYARPGERHAGALVEDLVEVTELAKTYGCSITFDTSHVRLSGGQLVDSWQLVRGRNVDVSVLHLVGCGGGETSGRVRGGLEVSEHALNTLDLEAYARFIHHVVTVERWTGVVIVEVSPTRASGSLWDRIDAIQRTLDFYFGEYRSYLPAVGLSLPGEATRVARS